VWLGLKVNLLVVVGGSLFLITAVVLGVTLIAVVG
jgi:hypothetical protein